MADVKNNSGSLSDEELVLAALEPDQLAEAKKQRIPRRRLRRGEAVVLLLLRIYLLFMLAVVVYQVWTGGH